MTEAVLVDETVQKPKRLIQATLARLKVAEYERTVHAYTAEFGTTREDLMRPDYWAHVAPHFKEWDRIEVRADDSTFFAEYLVRQTSKVWLILHELHFYMLGSIASTLQQTLRFMPEWKGPHNKWCVIRQSDNEIVARELSKEEAFKQAFEYERTM